MADLYFATSEFSGSPISIVKGGLIATVASGLVTLWTPAAGKRIVLYGYTLSLNAGNFAELEGNTFGAFGGVSGQNNSATVDFTRYPFALLIADEIIRLDVRSAVATNWAYGLWGFEI